MCATVVARGRALAPRAANARGWHGHDGQQGELRGGSARSSGAQVFRSQTWSGSASRRVDPAATERLSEPGIRVRNGKFRDFHQRPGFLGTGSITSFVWTTRRLPRYEGPIAVEAPIPFDLSSDGCDAI